MRPLTSSDILTLWDQGSRLHPVERALVILAKGCPEASVGELARLPLDERDHLLLELRVLTFGTRGEAVVTCPSCQEWLELELPTEALLEAPTSLTQGAVLELHVDGVPVRVRVPTSEDLRAAYRAGRDEQARACLLERCVGAETPSALSPAQRAQAFDALVERLPHIEVAFELVCTSCDHGWREPFDAGEYLWTELRARARRLLLEVHTLAGAYGWSEADVLAMSATRRQAYLSMVGA
jgi:hypothetical protein